MLYDFNAFNPHNVGTTIVPILQRRKLRPREVRALAQGHTVSNVAKLDLNPHSQRQAPLGSSATVYCWQLLAWD